MKRTITTLLEKLNDLTKELKEANKELNVLLSFKEKLANSNKEPSLRSITNIVPLFLLRYRQIDHVIWRRWVCLLSQIFEVLLWLFAFLNDCFQFKRIVNWHLFWTSLARRHSLRSRNFCFLWLISHTKPLRRDVEFFTAKYEVTRNI